VSADVSGFYTEDHESFRAVVREFMTREVEPSLDRWERQGFIDRELWTVAGKQGLLGTAFPAEYGGGGDPDWRYRCVFMDEAGRINCSSLNTAFQATDDLVGPYLLELATPEQMQRWMPLLSSGEWIAALAMTEPGAGSDLRGIRTTAVRDGDAWVLNGSKTFISNAIQADLALVFARTEDVGGRAGFSLLVVEEGMPGFTRGRKLEKVGMHAQDTGELFFTDVRVPAANLLGEAGAGFRYLMERLPKERMGIAWFGLANAEAVFDATVAYVKERTAFGSPVASFQNTKFELAEMRTKIDVTWPFLRQCALLLNEGRLTATEAAKAKWWATDLQTAVIDACLQLHGGYGYMDEYPVSKAWRDSRVQSIYGGTNEIMKEIIGRAMGL
jgi:long-chain-acyl-CoA dehydrogenase